MEHVGRIGGHVVKPQICLAMIVKDEARGIVQTLESVREHIDRWVILDTGSTDNTPNLCYRTMQDVLGGVYHHAFEDFSTTRNLALGFAAAPYAEEDCAWLLMLSGDSVVEHGELLRGIVEQAEAQGCVAVRLRLCSGGFTNTHLDLVKAHEGCHFRGLVHEAMNLPEGGKVYDASNTGLVIRYTTNDERDRARWVTDAELLESELAKMTPEERAKATRWTFYLAQTYECLGFNERAVKLYEQRVAMGGLESERFISQLRIARCRWRMLDSYDAISSAFADAIEMRPDRAEPLHEFSRFLFEIGDKDRAYLAARDSARVAFPVDDTHFIDADVYTWRAKDHQAVVAYHTGRFEECIGICQELITGPLPDSERERVRRNIAESEKALAKQEATTP